ncbi:MAG TPA: hypothetical protein VKV06_17055, partial [Acidimicrobiales bacterium]|nr:hypothetical protein [Acidimicrobiales bacterium]
MRTDGAAADRAGLPPPPPRPPMVAPAGDRPAPLWSLIASWVLAAAATAAGASPWLRAFSVPHAAVILAAAAVGPVALAVAIGWAARLPPAASYAASAIGLLVLVVVLSPHPGELQQLIAHEPTELLTETLPLHGHRGLLVPPAVVVWLAGAVTGELVVRARRPMAAPAAPLLAFLVAYAATTGGSARDEWTGPAVLAATIALALAVNARAPSAA